MQLQIVHKIHEQSQLIICMHVYMQELLVPIALFKRFTNAYNYCSTMQAICNYNNCKNTITEFVCTF